MDSEIYARAIENGCSPRLAEMFAAGKPPTIKTTNTFIAKGKTGGDQFGDATREHYLRTARAAGVSTDGKVYDGRLAEFPGDPRAWIESQDDVRRLCEERGWGLDGDVKVKAREAAPPATGGLADDIKDDLVEARLAEKYGDDFETVPKREYEKAVEDVVNTHSPPAHWEKA